MHKSPFNVLSKAISSLLLLALSWRFRWKSLPFTGHRLLHFQYHLQIRFLGFTFNRKEENPSLTTALFIFDLLRFGLVYSLFLHSCYCVYLLKVSDLGFMWVGRFLLNSNFLFSLFWMFLFLNLMNRFVGVCKWLERLVFCFVRINHEIYLSAYHVFVGKCIR